MTTASLSRGAAYRGRVMRIGVEPQGDRLLWCDGHPQEFGSPSSRIVRIEAPDMRDAQRQCLQIRAAWALEGHDLATSAVLADVEVVLADEASQARRRLAELGGWLRDRSHPALRYVGTPAGLAGMIGDMFVANVCDGVVVIPLESGNTHDAIYNQTIPWLQRNSYLKSVDE